MASNAISPTGSQALDHSSNTEGMQAPLEDSSKDLARTLNVGFDLNCCTIETDILQYTCIPPSVPKRPTNKTGDKP
jgi:hypothetical protein